MKTLFICALGITTSNAFVAELYSDQHCTNLVDTRNIWDDTCATTVGFQSFKIITSGSYIQYGRAYSPSTCFYDDDRMMDCVYAGPGGALGECRTTFNKDGGANALISLGTPCDQDDHPD